MQVYNMDLNRPEEEAVHGHLSMGVLDYIARMKTHGHAGTASDKNFCLYCKTKHFYLSEPEGFNSASFLR